MRIISFKIDPIVNGSAALVPARIVPLTDVLFRRRLFFMMLATFILSAAMAGQPTTAFSTSEAGAPKTQVHAPAKFTAIELHSMTEDEKRDYPGRERFDKTEWYESCFKSIRAVVAPEHVDEWMNGGIENT